MDDVLRYLLLVYQIFIKIIGFYASAPTLQSVPAVRGSLKNFRTTVNSRIAPENLFYNVFMKRYTPAALDDPCRNLRPSNLPSRAQSKMLAAELEHSEYRSNRQSALCAQDLDPGIDRAYLPIGAGGAVYGGPGSPLNYACGLPLDEPSGASALSSAAVVDAVKDFYAERHEPARIAVTSLDRLATFELLATQGFFPCRSVDVWCQTLNTPISGPVLAPGWRVEPVGHGDTRIWAETVLRGYSPEKAVDPYESAVLECFAATENAVLFVAAHSTTPSAAAAMTVQRDVAVLFSAATLPPFRRQGLQTALLAARLQMAQQHFQCRWAAVSTEPHSSSSHNVMRMGFTHAYSQITWQARHLMDEA